MTARQLPEPIDRLDRRITSTLARVAVPTLRAALGIVFLWFGVLKLFPDLSPAETLVGRTIEVLTLGLITPAVSVPVLGAWESLIGVGLIVGRGLRGVLFLLAVQMAGTFTPLLLFPGETFSTFPLVPTLEGQYIIKNIVLIGAAMVVGATVRGGGLSHEAELPPAAVRRGTPPAEATTPARASTAAGPGTAGREVR
ncbi:MAG TPA: DoxX family membrane protein [Candidatus Binatia bacterium]|nr:DoxX family membrane protein [Candidatus Binatia bacterium]